MKSLTIEIIDLLARDPVLGLVAYCVNNPREARQIRDQLLREQRPILNIHGQTIALRQAQVWEFCSRFDRTVVPLFANQKAV